MVGTKRKCFSDYVIKAFCGSQGLLSIYSMIKNLLEKASEPASDREKKSSNGSKQSDADDPLNLANPTDMDAQMDGDSDSAKKPEPDKQYRAALLRGRFADTILKAREKTLDQVFNCCLSIG
ncbi:transcription factor GTE9-like protein [Carex littledalei]|uniref:Transcription factor GTE9-like protein n=1 Tax=Carex littledalei TaxID=544730 RepID=A0A833QRP4_9POAL|nr:transcription factor GTE9-like protein [Carex littledalei]